MRDDFIIIRVDGGIGSQIGFIALGMAFQEKGYKVKYDLSWFETEGKGFYNTEKSYNENYDVCFDIPKAFPELNIDVANHEEVERYKTLYFIDRDDAIELQAPLYIGGYLGRHYDIYFAHHFTTHFSPKEIEQKNTPFYMLLQEILATQSCGIHIRRGDLSQNHVVYGEPTSLTYFERVIQLVLQMDSKSVFYLFSDDVAWTKQHIVPLLKDKKFKVCDINMPDQGYLDLYLLSRCKVIIASQGSMGACAKMLSPYNPLLISPKYRDIFNQMENVMLVNFGEQTRIIEPSKSAPATAYFYDTNWAVQVTAKSSPLLPPPPLHERNLRCDTRFFSISTVA